MEVDGACVPVTPTDSGTDADGGTDSTEDDADAFVSACDPRCAAPTEHRDEDGVFGTAGVCVACLETSDCDEPGGEMCEGGACVQCVNDSDCDSATLPVCGDDGQCVPCTVGENAGCDGVMDGATALGVCADIDGVNECVGCTEATAADDCGDFSCNPATNRCTETERGNVPSCGACVSDFECAYDAGTRCVPMNFRGANLGGFCLRQKEGECSRVLSTTIIAESLSGDPETEYCGVDQTSTTCEAVAAMSEGRRCRAPAQTGVSSW